MTELDALVALRRLPFAQRLEVWRQAGHAARTMGHRQSARVLSRRFGVWRAMRLRESMRGRTP